MTKQDAVWLVAHLKFKEELYKKILIDVSVAVNSDRITRFIDSSLRTIRECDVAYDEAVALFKNKSKNK